MITKGATVLSGKLGQRKMLLNYPCADYLPIFRCSEAYCYGEMTGLGKEIAPIIGDIPIRETTSILIV